jgi:hypothetical protein
MFKRDDEEGYRMSREFKDTFAIPGRFARVLRRTDIYPLI